MVSGRKEQTMEHNSNIWTGWTMVKGHWVYVLEGKVSWAIDALGEHQGIYIGEKSIGGKYTEAYFRRLVSQNKVIFR